MPLTLSVTWRVFATAAIIQQSCEFNTLSAQVALLSHMQFYIPAVNNRLLYMIFAIIIMHSPHSFCCTASLPSTARRSRRWRADWSRRMVETLARRTHRSSSAARSSRSFRRRRVSHRRSISPEFGWPGPSIRHRRRSPRRIPGSAFSYEPVKGHYGVMTNCMPGKCM